jgi:hypothetical protein
MDPAGRLQRLLERIDALNAEDPNTETADGASHPRELLYARRLSAWVLRLTPDASEALRIASRGQHLRRWTIPRDRYPRTRGGYLRWRETLKTFHADEVSALMQQAGYPEADLKRVRSLILKKAPPGDAEAQALEDALCLVFLETQFAGLRRKTPEEKMIEVLQKTWKKMGPQGRAEALKLPLGAGEKALLAAALKAR